VLTIRGLSSRVRFLAVSGATFLIAGMPYFAYSWGDILHALTTYESRPWVASAIFASLGISHATHRIIFFLLTIGLSLFMNIPPRRVPLFLQVGAVTALFLGLAPGFGIQYFAWAVPWVAGLGAPTALIYYLVPAAFLARLYTIWCRGLPWYLADDTSSPPGNDRMFVVLGLLAVVAGCWMLSMFICSMAGMRRGAAECSSV
jgi:hypothetical protein